MGTGLYAKPDPKCSPGALNPDVTQRNIDSTICKSGWTKPLSAPYLSDRPGGAGRQVKAYGHEPSAHGFELHYVVSLEGGGLSAYASFYPSPIIQRKD